MRVFLTYMGSIILAALAMNGDYAIGHCPKRRLIITQLDCASIRNKSLPILTRLGEECTHTDMNLSVFMSYVRVGPSVILRRSAADDQSRRARRSLKRQFVVYIIITRRLRTKSELQRLKTGSIQRLACLDVLS